MPTERTGKRNYEHRKTFLRKFQAVEHGFIQYGKNPRGARQFRVWKTKRGFSVAKKPEQKPIRQREIQDNQADDYNPFEYL